MPRHLCENSHCCAHLALDLGSCCAFVAAEKRRDFEKKDSSFTLLDERKPPSVSRFDRRDSPVDRDVFRIRCFGMMGKLKMISKDSHIFTSFSAAPCASHIHRPAPSLLAFSPHPTQPNPAQAKPPRPVPSSPTQPRPNPHAPPRSPPRPAPSLLNTASFTSFHPQCLRHRCAHHSSLISTFLLEIWPSHWSFLIDVHVNGHCIDQVTQYPKIDVIRRSAQSTGKLAQTEENSPSSAAQQKMSRIQVTPFILSLSLSLSLNPQSQSQPQSPRVISPVPGSLESAAFAVRRSLTGSRSALPQTRSSVT